MEPDKNFNRDRSGQKGTKEWSDKSYNICDGCEHGCLYCFAKVMRARFDPAVRQPGVWQKQCLKNGKNRLGTELGACGVVMFPTTHDIVPTFLGQCLVTLKNLLRENQVLIVTKPHLPVVRTLCRELAADKARILFRFTIGSTTCLRAVQSAAGIRSSNFR